MAFQSTQGHYAIKENFTRLAVQSTPLEPWVMSTNYSPAWLMVTANSFQPPMSFYDGGMERVGLTRLRHHCRPLSSMTPRGTGRDTSSSANNKKQMLNASSQPWGASLTMAPTGGSTEGYSQLNSTQMEETRTLLEAIKVAQTIMTSRRDAEVNSRREISASASRFVQDHHGIHHRG
ncbi:unnamed protein product [Sphagnum tenellum]